MDPRPPETFSTPRLLLRKPEHEDGPVVFARWCQDPEVARFMTWRPHDATSVSSRFVASLLDQWHDGTAFSWFLVPLDDRKPVGTVGFVADPPNAELGFALARPWWRQGLMTEALRCLLDWLLAHPSIHRVSAICDVDNAASARLLENCGLHRLGLLRERAVFPNISDQPRDCYSFCRIKPD